MKIKDIGRVVTGKTPSTKIKENFEGTIPFVTPEDICEGYIIKNTIRHISEKGYLSILSNTLEDTSILVGCIGSDMGNVAITNCRCASNQQINAITNINKEWNPFYVYYNLSLKKKYFRQLAGMTTTPILPKSVFEEIDIPFVDIKLQTKIVNILKTIDDKIEINKKINITLENMVKAIYDYWFLQFEFPNDDGKPYKSSGGKMVWEAELKKEIPEGWNINVIKDFCKIFTGKKDVNQSSEFGKYKFYSCAPDYKFSNEKIYEGKAILVSGNGSYTGRTIFIDDAFDLYQRTYACVNKTSENYLIYIYYSMLKNFVPKVSGGTHGSAIPYIVFDDIAKEKILINKTAIEKFQKIALPIQEKIIKNNSETEKLVYLRDFLSPLLMSGQIGFKDE